MLLKFGESQQNESSQTSWLKKLYSHDIKEEVMIRESSPEKAGEKSLIRRLRNCQQVLEKMKLTQN
jgi:hypothetical protein